MFKLIFLIASLLLFLFLFVYKVYICKLKRTPKISAFVSAIGGVLLFYILSSFVYGIFVVGIVNKIILFLLTLSPFVIGKFATYEKERLYSCIQIFVVAFGFFYVLII